MIVSSFDRLVVDAHDSSAGTGRSAGWPAASSRLAQLVEHHEVVLLKASTWGARGGAWRLRSSGWKWNSSCSSCGSALSGFADQARQGVGLLQQIADLPHRPRAALAAARAGRAARLGRRGLARFAGWQNKFGWHACSILVRAGPRDSGGNYTPAVSSLRTPELQTIVIFCRERHGKSHCTYTAP